MAYAIFNLLSSAQGVVDLLWIFVYNESYLNKKKEVDGKKARSEEEKENSQKESDKRARCYHIFFASLLVINVILGIMYIICTFEWNEYARGKDFSSYAQHNFYFYGTWCVLIGLAVFSFV